MEIFPLVSICIPTFNRERLVWRAIESSINQTYKNIEIVIVDNASTDKTDEVVSRYMKHDWRIKYFKNKTNIGSGNNYLKCAEYATGYFIEALGSDDWLSRNYIEEGVKNFLANPDAAAILTNTIGLEFQKDNSFRFLCENIIKSGRYSADWFFRNVYNHPFLGSKGFLSFMRREDFIHALKTELKRPTSLIERNGGIPEPIDGVVFWGVLENYEYFIMTNNIAYITVSHTLGNVGLQGGFIEREDGYIRYAFALRRAYESFAANSKKIKKYVNRICFYLGLNIITDTCSKLLKQRASLKEWKIYFSILFKIFFADYSKKRKVIFMVTVIPYFLIRTIRHFLQFFSETSVFVPSQNYFLTEGFEFKAE